MPSILLVNPRKRRTKKRRATRRKNPVAKKRRTAAQKAATRKMIAANRRSRGSTRRKNPVKRKARRAAAPVRRRRTAARRSTRRRRNPVSPTFSMRSIQNQVIDAGMGAVGALGLDVVQGYLPIPANLKTGLVGTGVKALLAIGLGVVAAKTKLVKSSTAAKFANGALIVVLHDELKKQVATFAPGIQMGEYLDDFSLGYYGSGYNPAIDAGVGTYLPDLETDDMGFQQDGFGEYLNADPSVAMN